MHVLWANHQRIEHLQEMRPYHLSYLELTGVLCLQLLRQTPEVAQDTAICVEFRLQRVAH